MVVDTVPNSDPAYPIVTALLRAVPTSRWAFARIASDGGMIHLLASEGNAGDLSGLQSEFERQRLKVKTGPRIGAALGPLAKLESGITLLFADARSTFGILTLFRIAELGPFTSSEVGSLTFALAAASDQFSALLQQPSEGSSVPTVPFAGDPSMPTESPEAAFCALDRETEIILACNSEDQRRIAPTGLRTRDRGLFAGLAQACVAARQ